MQSGNDAQRILPVGERVKSVMKVSYRARRGVLLVGSPGIGKSEIVEQVACELGIGYRVLNLALPYMLKSKTPQQMRMDYLQLKLEKELLLPEYLRK